MLPYYLVPFLQRKLFEQQQVEERRERRQEKLLANQQNLGEVLLHMQIKRRRRGIYTQEKV